MWSDDDHWGGLGQSGIHSKRQSQISMYSKELPLLAGKEASHDAFLQWR